MSTATSNPPAASRAPVVRVISGWQRLLAVAAGSLMRLWTCTLHLQPSAATLRLMAGDPRPTLFILWHNRLFVATEISRRYRPARPLHSLVSASKDGAWLSAFFESTGMRVVRGSSSRGGREAVGALVDVLRGGHDAGITPDGPRGPCYEFKPGALVVARRARARVVLVGITYSRAWTVPSWDRFLIPHPFTRARLHAEWVPDQDLHRDDAIAHLQARLVELNPDPDVSREISPDRAQVIV